MALILSSTSLHCTSIDTVSMEYQGQNITCNNGEACIIRCDLEDACLNTVIFCPSDADCTITCTALYSCDGFSVHCSHTNLCSINCNGERSCRNMNLYPPNNSLLLRLSHPGISALYGVRYPIYPVDDYKDYALECDTLGECAGMNLICPKYAHCDITCTATTACSRMLIEWPLTPGFGTIFCDPSTRLNSVCWGTNFPPPDPYTQYSVLCGGTSACAFAHIICPTNASCNVTCSGKSSCMFNEIQCPIYGNCAVSCNSGECYKAQISWSSLATSRGTLICDECISVPTPPTLAPTAFPTVYTLSPTLSTLHPTAYPTAFTLAPTQNPTQRAPPTYKIPPTTSYPSVPSPHPTLTPTIAPSSVPLTISASDGANTDSFIDTLLSQSWSLYVIIGFIVIVILCFGFCAMCFLVCLIAMNRRQPPADREVVVIQDTMEVQHDSIPMYANSQMTNHIVPDAMQLPDAIPDADIMETQFAQYPFTLSSTTAAGEGLKTHEDAPGAMWWKEKSISISDAKKHPQRVLPRLSSIMEMAMEGKRKANRSISIAENIELNRITQNDDGHIQYGKCIQMGCVCTEYVNNASKWSNNLYLCQTCNHNVNQHKVVSDPNMNTAGYIE